jgi:hypothetical protein
VTIARSADVSRLAAYFVGLLVSVVVMFRTDPDGGAFSVAGGFAVAFATLLIDTALVHGRYFKLAWYGVRTWRGHVRVSASYLYRIRVDNRYLLVKGNRFDQYQPVGGVYKSHSSSSGRRNELKVLTDNLLVPDAVSEEDLRVRVPGRNLLAFVRWFEEGRGREVDGWREFFEELIASGILPGDAFGFVKYDVVERYHHPLRYSEWAQSQELLVADILELLPTPEQLTHLKNLMSHSDPRYLWATEDQIRRRGAVPNTASQTTRIAETAEWTI